VVIEPPRYAGRRRVLEIDDGVFVALELFLIEKRSGTMHQANVLKFGVLANAFPVKPRKKCSRTGSIKTFVVVKDPYLHRPFPLPPAAETPDVSR
jgi:hypothetical protein